MSQSTTADVPLTWVSLHLSVQSLLPRVVDDILCQVVHQVLHDHSVTQRVRRWFFIRYSEGGPHIRLRVQVPRERHDACAVELVAALEARTPVDVAGFPRQHRDVEQVRTLQCQYVPEVLRYGGPEGLTLAEGHFHASSLAVLRLLLDRQLDPTSRLGLGLTASVIMLGAARRAGHDIRELAAASEAQFGHSVLVSRVDSDSAVRDIIDTDSVSVLLDRIMSASDEGTLPHPFDEYDLACARYLAGLHDAWERGHLALPSHAAQIRRASWITHFVPSISHMTMNRLGITRDLEARLAHLVSAAMATRTERFAPAGSAVACGEASESRKTT